MLVNETVGNVQASYEIAVEVCRLRDKKTYGGGAIKTAAQQLGVTPSRLYQYDHVARAYPTKQVFGALTKERNARGLPLSFSHIIELASEKDDGKRAERTKKTLEHAWSVEELRKDRERTPGRGRQPTMRDAIKSANVACAGFERAVKVIEGDCADVSNDDLRTLQASSQRAADLAAAVIARVTEVVRQRGPVLAKVRGASNESTTHAGAAKPAKVAT